MVRRTKEEAQVTRQRLLDAAELLFQSQGVSQTTLQQIAQQAGTTRGAIYWHFKDKADLFNAMMERVTLPMEASLRAAVDAGASSPLALVERGIMDAFRLATSDPQVRRVFEIASYKVEYTQEMTSVHERHLFGRQACIDDFEKALRLAAHQARVRLPIPATTAAQGLHALIGGLMQDWLLAPGSFALLPAGRRLFHVYLRGLGLTPPDAGVAACETCGQPALAPAARGSAARSAIIADSRAAAPRNSRRISTDRIRPSEG